MELEVSQSLTSKHSTKHNNQNGVVLARRQMGTTGAERGAQKPTRTHTLRRGLCAGKARPCSSTHDAGETGGIRAEALHILHR